MYQDYQFIRNFDGDAVFEKFLNIFNKNVENSEFWSNLANFYQNWMILCVVGFTISVLQLNRSSCTAIWPYIHDFVEFWPCCTQSYILITTVFYWYRQVL